MAAFDRSAPVLPVVTLVELSIKRTVSEPGAPLKSPAATKRRLWLDATSSGTASVGLPTAAQLVPL